MPNKPSTNQELPGGSRPPTLAVSLARSLFSASIVYAPDVSLTHQKPNKRNTAVTQPLGRNKRNIAV